MSNNLMQQFLGDGPGDGPLSAEVFRSNIEATEKFMLALPGVQVVPVHRFAEGLYCRQLTMPANTIWMSRVHKHENYAFIMSGSCTVISENGRETFHAPMMLTTRVGTKRLLRIHDEDCTWITIHALPSDLDQGSSPEEIEEYLACNTLEEFDKYLIGKNETGGVLL